MEVTYIVYKQPYGGETLKKEGGPKYGKAHTEIKER